MEFFNQIASFDIISPEVYIRFFLVNYDGGRLSLFDVMGPIMIGPSSSHTAGAARIGLFARLIYNRDFKSVSIILYNSFADTGIGHGTDRAIIGGLLGMTMDDPGLKTSFEEARKSGLEFSFEFREDIDKHPNFAQIVFPGSEKDFTVGGISLGGGRIKIAELNDIEVDFGGRHDLLILEYRDIPGMIGFIGETLGDAKINIAYVQISRDANEERTLAVLKLDQFPPDDVTKKIRSNKNIFTVTAIKKFI